MYDFLSKANILIIDDFSGFRLSLKSMLHRLGAQNIDQACNGSEALKRCTENSYDIIFCDYNLGKGQDGQQILEELHQRSLLYRGTLFLMVTAETTKAQVIGAIEYRPDAYLSKPFSGEQLGQRLKRLILKNAALDKIYSAINIGDINRALKLCDDVIDEMPKLRFSCLRIKSELLEQQYHYPEALALYNDVIKEQPLLWAMLGIGRIYFNQCDITRARDHFMAMRESFPAQVSVLDWIARCQVTLGESENAENTIREAIAISPKSVSRQATLGEIALSLNHQDIAQQAFTKTIHEGNYSCLLKPQHFENFYDTTREVAKDLHGRDKTRLLAETDAVVKQMERKYEKDPSSMAAGLSSAALFFSEVEKTDKTPGILSKLSRVLGHPDCKLSARDAEYIQHKLQAIEGDRANEKYVKNINSRLAEITQEIEEKPEIKVTAAEHPATIKKEIDWLQVAKSINLEGILLTRQERPQEALEKFREAIKIFPDNAAFLLNAAQIIISHKAFNNDPELIEEARHYLCESISIDESDIRWSRYQKLLNKLPHACTVLI